MTVSLQNIIDQVNNNDLETTIFTNRIGGNSGTRGKGCGSCLVRFWDWLTCSGISYDKNSVTGRINEAFRRATHEDLNNYRDSLETFKTRLEEMETKFSKKGPLQENLQQTITKVDDYLSYNLNPSSDQYPCLGTRERGGGQMDGASAARANTLQPRTNRRVRKQAEAQGNRAALIRSVAAKAKPKYCDVVETCYGPDSRYIGKVMEWVDKTSVEIELSFKDIKKPSLLEIRTQFEANMQQKIIAYNENKLKKAIPDFLTNDAYGLEQVSDWLYGTSATGQLREFMMTIPFSNDAIKHIQAKANDSLLMNISGEQGIKYCDVVETCYGRDSRYMGKVMEWVADIYAEILQSLGKEIEEPLNPDEIRIQFETIMGQKILAYNFKKLERAIPDLFTGDTYGSAAEETTDWIYGTSATGQLRDFMTTIPFSSEAIRHIKAKLPQSTTPKAKKAESPAESPLEMHIKALNRKSDTEVLGLQPGYTTRAVINAYRKLARTCHPDKLGSLPLADQKLAEETFKRINKAHETLNP